MVIDRIPTPTPLTDEEYAQLQIKHEIERQERLLATVGTHSVLEKLSSKFADIQRGTNSVVMIGTVRQRCADDTVDNITGTYSLNLTDDMLEAYKENNNQLLIIK